MAESPNHRIDGPTAIAAGISLLIFAYIAIRAATLCITIDEALTYNWHVSGGWGQIVTFTTPGLPDNNHVLYTLLSKISVTLFGLSELTLRLPSLLGCLFYLAGLNLCLRRIVPGWRQVVGVLALGLNPYVVDFLGLARGYGLGLGFTMLGLDALLSSLTGTPGKVRRMTAQSSLLLFGLAALSNLSFLLVLGSAMFVIAIRLAYAGVTARPVTDPAESPWLLLVKIVVPVLPIIAYLAIPLEIIRKDKLFDMGGHTGFWDDTVISLFYGTIYNSPWLMELDSLLLEWIKAAALFLPVALVVLSRSDKRKFAMFSVLAGMTATVILLSIAQHSLMHVAFLQGRRGLYLIPLFLLTVLALGDPPKGFSRWFSALAMTIGLLVPAVFAVNGLTSMNFHYIFDWNEYGGTRSAMVAVKEKIEREKPDVPVLMRTNWLFEPNMNFYRRALGLESLLSPIRQGGLDGPADFYYGYTRDEGIMTKHGARPLLRQTGSGTLLFERSGRDVGQ
jgi:hypothetical protein